MKKIYAVLAMHVSMCWIGIFKPYFYLDHHNITPFCLYNKFFGQQKVFTKTMHDS